MRQHQVLVAGALAFLFALFASALLFPVQFAAQADELSPQQADETITPIATDTTPLPTATITPTATPIPPTSTPIALEPLEAPEYAGLVVAYDDNSVDTACVNLADVQAAGEPMTAEGVLNTLNATDSFSFTMARDSQGTSLCAVESTSGSEGCPADNCFCYPDGKFWAVLTTTLALDDQQWTPASTGIADIPVEGGSMLGVSWTTWTDGPTTLPPFQSFEEMCVFKRHAGVVVDYLDGSYDTACVDLGSDGQATAEEVIRAARSVSATIQMSDFGAAVCKIEGSGSAGCPANDCFCDPDGKSWAFWKQSEQGWRSSPAGISSVTVRDGEIVGFSWTGWDSEGGNYTPIHSPRSMPFNQICNESRGRAGLVVSDGRMFETRCVELGGDGQASGEEILRASGMDVTLEQTGSGAAVCKIDATGCNYPDEDCFCSTRSWSYWYLDNETWKPRETGISSSSVMTGNVEGFSWTGYDNQFRPLERPVLRSFNRICVPQLLSDSPVILSMKPSSGSLTIQGKNFTDSTRAFLLHKVEVPASALAATANLTSTEIELDILSRSEDMLRAALPQSLPVGSYSLMVENNDEHFDALEDVYTMETVALYLPLVQR